MTKIKIQRAFAHIGILSILLSSQAYASQIGTGSVIGSSSLDTSIVWDDLIPGTATGIIDGITVTANVLPILNMVISSGSIELGTLNNSTYVTGNIDIEVGTNARNGASISARSSNGGLYSSVAGSTINNLGTDGIAESYLFSSTSSGGSDSSIGGFNQTFLTNTEINDTSTDYTIYSSTKAQSSSGSADVSFNVSARIDAQTPAANDYKDIVVLTILGNF